MSDDYIKELNEQIAFHILERDDARRDRETLQMAVVEANQKLRHLEAERGRLREALLYIEGSSDDPHAVRIARKALAATEDE